MVSVEAIPVVRYIASLLREDGSKSSCRRSLGSGGSLVSPMDRVLKGWRLAAACLQAGSWATNFERRDF